MTRPSQRQIAVAVIAIVAAVVARSYFVSLRAPSIGTFHDDGVYLATAKALATGQGYRIISLPGQPTQTKYPVLFPWLLSLVWRVGPAFPDNLTWLRLVPFGAALVWFYLSWRLIRRLGGSPIVAATAIAMTIASSWTLFLSTSLLSESLFATLVTASLLLLDRIESRTAASSVAIGAGALMGAAFLARTAAIAPAAAGLLWLLLRKNWRAAIQFAAAAGALAAPWIWWTAAHGGDPIVDSFYSASNYRSWNIVFNYPLSDKLAVLYVNVLWAIQVGQYWGLAAGSVLAWIVAGVFVPCIARGLWLGRRSPTAIATAFYIALVLAWAYLPMRFVIPILPLLIWFLFLGAGRLQPAIAVFAGMLLVSASLQTWHLGKAMAQRGGVWFEPSGVDDWHALSNLFNWVDTNTPADAVVIATHDPTVYLLTGRRALRPNTPDPLMLYYNVSGRPLDTAAVDEAFRQRILNIHADYVVITPRDDIETIRRLSKKYPESFAVAFGDPKDLHAIYRIDRTTLRGQ